jgi:hypothetical protein
MKAASKSKEIQQLSKPEETQVESREVRKPYGDNHFKKQDKEW